MSFELVYTSARRGLRPGATGFCTVAATEGISRALQDKLESLSGYSYTEAVAGSAPPINRSHITIRIQRTVYHVVSRIGHVAGEHTNRTNKIAHHLALTSEEIEQFHDGPAAMFADDSFWFERWTDDPRTFPKDRYPDSFPEPVDGFSTWEGIFGDAGWAGLLGHAIATGFKSVSVIVPSGKDTMLLLNEALQLVKPEDRWNVCFSTYYTRQTSGTQCHWRFVMDGTSEARHLRARTQTLLVDPVGSSIELPDDNPFVQAARAGCPGQAHEMAAARLRRPAGSSFTRDSADADEDDRPVRPSIQRRREALKQKAGIQKSSPFDIPEEEYAHVQINSNETTDSQPRRSGGRRKNMWGLWLVSGLALAVLAILVYLGIKQLV